MTKGPEVTSPRTRKISLAVMGTAIAAALVYGMTGFSRNPADTSANASCTAASHAAAARIAPFARGEVAAVNVAQEPQPLPRLAFNDASGAPKTLSDFQGRVVLLNLWATWCVPCRTEMPALDALQAKLGSDDFQVVAVNIDTRNSEKPKAWLKEAGITRLDYFADPSAKIFQELKAVGKAIGMPTTLLIDKSGCEIASLAGPAEWASSDAIKFVQAALEK